MKIKLTPEISYLAGLCKHTKSRDGVGVRGTDEILQAFCAHVLENKIMPSTKILTKGSEAKFHHTVYRSLIFKTYDNQTTAFRHHNEYAASFLAGLFDSVGEFYKDHACLATLDSRDWDVIEQLGFKLLKKDQRYLVGPKDTFLKFIKHYRRVDDFYLQERAKSPRKEKTTAQSKTSQKNKSFQTYQKKDNFDKPAKKYSSKDNL